MIHDKDEANCPWCRMRKHVHESEAGTHFRNARREMLLGVRHLIESCLERLEAEPAKDDEGTARKVDIS